MQIDSRLAKRIALGKVRVVILYGVLGVGVPAAIGVAVGDFLLRKEVGTIDVVWLSVFGAILGLLLGFYWWTVWKRRYDAAIIGMGVNEMPNEISEMNGQAGK